MGLDMTTRSSFLVKKIQSKAEKRCRAPVVIWSPALSDTPRIVVTITKVHREWVKAGSSGNIARRNDRWSESIAASSEGFVEQVKNELGPQGITSLGFGGERLVCSSRADAALWRLFR
jgi:hypothetical protein